MGRKSVSVMGDPETDKIVQQALASLKTVYDADNRVDGWVNLLTLHGYRVDAAFNRAINKFLNSTEKDGKEIGACLCHSTKANKIEVGKVCTGDECSVRLEDCSGMRQVGTIHTHPNRNIGNSLADVYSAATRIKDAWMLDIAQMAQLGIKAGEVSDEIFKDARKFAEYAEGEAMEPFSPQINCNLIAWEGYPVTGELSCLVKKPGASVEQLNEFIKQTETLLRNGLPASMPGEIVPGFVDFFDMKEIPLFTITALQHLYSNPGSYVEARPQSWKAEMAAVWGEKVVQDRIEMLDRDKLRNLLVRISNTLYLKDVGVLKTLRRFCADIEPRTDLHASYQESFCSLMNGLVNNSAMSELKISDAGAMCGDNMAKAIWGIQDEVKQMKKAESMLQSVLNSYASENQYLKSEGKPEIVSKEPSDMMVSHDDSKRLDNMRQTIDMMDLAISEFKRHWENRCMITAKPTTTNRQWWASSRPINNKAVPGKVVGQVW